MYNALVIIAAEIPADPLSSLIGILFWIARCVLLLIGGGGGLFMIVKGKTEDKPDVIQEGFFGIGGAAVLFAATFAVEAIFK